MRSRPDGFSAQNPLVVLYHTPEPKTLTSAIRPLTIDPHYPPSSRGFAPLPLTIRPYRICLLSYLLGPKRSGLLCLSDLRGLYLLDYEILPDLTPLTYKPLLPIRPHRISFLSLLRLQLFLCSTHVLCSAALTSSPAALTSSPAALASGCSYFRTFALAVPSAGDAFS